MIERPGVRYAKEAAAKHLREAVTTLAALGRLVKDDSDSWAIVRLRELWDAGEVRASVCVQWNQDGIYRVLVRRADGSLEEAPR